MPRPGNCKATVQGDEYFCAECGVRWDHSEDLAELGVEDAKCLMAERIRMVSMNALASTGEIVMTIFTEFSDSPQGECYQPSLPAWMNDPKASYVLVKSRAVLLTHPHHTPKIFTLKDKKFVDLNID